MILLGEVLAKGGTVRVRPLDGGGNELQVEAPAGGDFYVKGLENGDYEAVDEAGARRVFTVSEGPGEEILLERFADADAPEGAELGPNYGTEAASVADESNLIQHGIAPMTVRAGTAVLERSGSEVASVLNPPTFDPAAPGAGTLPVDAEEEPLTGEALHARAAELEIAGRSSLSADELRAAVAAAEQGSDVPPEDDPEHT